VKVVKITAIKGTLDANGLVRRKKNFRQSKRSVNFVKRLISKIDKASSMARATQVA